MDHQHFLGDSLKEIAREKAGILKRNTFGIISEQDPEALDVIQDVAASVGATLKIHGHHWHVWETDSGGLGYQDEYGQLDLPTPGLSGKHQLMNAGCAVAALRILGVQLDAIAAAVGRIETSDWPARMQPVRDTELSFMHLMRRFGWMADTILQLVGLWRRHFAAFRADRRIWCAG